MLGMRAIEINKGKRPTDSIGERMRVARRAAGMTITEMAAELEISHSTVSRWETGDEPPRRMALMGYALLCGVDLEWLEELWHSRFSDGAAAASTTWYAALPYGRIVAGGELMVARPVAPLGQRWVS